MIYTEQQESRTAELILLLEELGNPGLSKHDLKRYGDRLKTIYLSEEGDLYRHSYSEITNYMYCNHVTDGVPTPDPGSVILENLREIDADWEADNKCENKDLLCSAIRKLIDHINLEVVRLGQMADIYYKLTEADALKTQLDGVAGGVQEVKKTLQEQENEVERIESGLEKRKQEVEDLKQDVKNYNAQAITVLSIFTCVVFAFTGGFSLITGSLNVLANLSKSKSFLLVGILLMLALVMADTIYMLLRAARHYPNANEGHLRGFILVNIIVGFLSLVIMSMYFFPTLFSFCHYNSIQQCETLRFYSTID